MSDKSNLAIGAGIGVAAGAGAGFGIGTMQATKKGAYLMKNFKQNYDQLLKGYVDQRIEANMDYVRETYKGRSTKNLARVYKRIIEKAKEDFPVVYAKNADKIMKSTKIKYAAAITAAGLAIGAATAAIINKVKASKAQKQVEQNNN